MGTTEATEDPYEACSIHGLWPLVADPAAPAGLRFADLAEDRPEECLAGPENLADVDFAIRTFGSEQERDAWIAAAREFGGNAVVLTPGPHMPEGGIQMCLVGWLNRDGARGAASLEEAIPLLRDLERKRDADGSLRDPVAAGAACRGRVLRFLEARREQQAWGRAWADQTAALAGEGPLTSNPFGRERDDDLRFRVHDRHGVEGRLRRVDGTLRAILPSGGLGDLDADLAAGLKELVSERGWAWTDGGIGRDIPALDLAAQREIADTSDLFVAAWKRVTSLVAARRTLRALTIDPETMRTLRRMAEGFPVASTRYRDPAAQFAPRTGKSATVAGSRVKRLFETGLIAPVWWHEPRRKSDDRALPVAPLDFIEGILWGLTPTGRAFLDRGVEAAAETQPGDEATALSWKEGRLRRGAVPPAALRRLESAVVDLPPSQADGVLAEACRRNRIVRHVPRFADHLAIAGAALACGALKAKGDELAE